MTPAQIALDLLLAQKTLDGSNPSIKKLARLEENIGALLLASEAHLSAGKSHVSTLVSEAP